MSAAVRRGAVVGLGTLLLLAPGLAEACSVCMSGRDDETRNAFLLTTGFLSVLPLLMVGGLLWWLRRRLRDMESRTGAGERAPEVAADPLPHLRGGTPARG